MDVRLLATMIPITKGPNVGPFELAKNCHQPAAAAGRDSWFWVASQYVAKPNGYYRVIGQPRSADGGALGPVVEISFVPPNTYPGQRTFPRVDALRGDRWLVTWLYEDTNFWGSGKYVSAVYGRIVGKNGAPITDVFLCSVGVNIPLAPDP